MSGKGKQGRKSRKNPHCISTRAGLNRLKPNSTRDATLEPMCTDRLLFTLPTHLLPSSKLAWTACIGRWFDGEVWVAGSYAIGHCNDSSLLDSNLKLQNNRVHTSKVFYLHSWRFEGGCRDKSVVTGSICDSWGRGLNTRCVILALQLLRSPTEGPLSSEDCKDCKGTHKSKELSTVWALVWLIKLTCTFDVSLPMYKRKLLELSSFLFSTSRRHK